MFSQGDRVEVIQVPGVIYNGVPVGTQGIILDSAVRFAYFGEAYQQAAFDNGPSGWMIVKAMRKLELPKPPTREDHQLIPWDRCVWQPNKVSV